MLLRAGKTIDEAVKLLHDLCEGGLNDVKNGIPNIGAASFDQLMTAAILAYERWTSSARAELRMTFRDGRVTDRLRAERYWIIVGSSTNSARTASMMHTELNELHSYFITTANELRLIKDRLSQTSRWVLDTNDLLHYYRLDTIPWAAIYGRGAHIMLPHVVIDEIDSKATAPVRLSRSALAALTA